MGSPRSHFKVPQIWHAAFSVEANPRHLYIQSFAAERRQVVGCEDVMMITILWSARVNDRWPLVVPKVTSIIR